jgi:hypothetical protein
MDFGVVSRFESRSIIALFDFFAVRRHSTMNRLAFAFTLSLLMFLNPATHAQDNPSSNQDAVAVRTTVTNYIEAYYTGDVARMEQTLHPHYLKHKIHGDIPVREQTSAQLIGSVRAGDGTHLPQAQRTEQVTVLDVAGNIAAAKLVTPGWTDYMTLSKANGEWKILSVVQRFD